MEMEIMKDEADEESLLEMELVEVEGPSLGLELTENEGSLSTGQYFRSSAEKFFNSGNVEEAFKNYLICLRLYPEWREEIKDKFVLILCAYGEILEEKKEYDNLFSCYEDALEVFQDCPEILCNLGAHLLRLGFYQKAYCYFLDALQRNAKYLPAFRNMQNVAACLVERWHFRMLNDSCRNEAFKEAISTRIEQNFDVVLDIGTGTGLLSIYAAQSGAKEIYGCDYNREMIVMADEILNKNNLSERIIYINKLSDDLQIPDDISSRVSLVVTETIDCGLLGEHLLKTLSYAWEHLLLPPYPFEEGRFVANDGTYGVVIPSAANMFAVGIECLSIAKRFYHPLRGARVDECTNALEDATLTEDEFPASARRGISTNMLNLHVNIDEPYDTECLSNTEHKMLTTCYKFLHINFNDPNDIKDHTIGAKSQHTFTMIANDNGYLHAFAVWFTVDLDENVSLSSCPTESNSKDCCWEQAIFSLPTPIYIVPGTTLDVAGSWQNGKLSLLLIGFDYPERYECPSMDVCTEPPVGVPPTIIRMLNDNALVRHLTAASVDYCSQFCKSDVQSLVILDLYPVPLFGLNVLKNSRLFTAIQTLKLFCLVESDTVRDCIRCYAISNEINLDYIQFLQQDEFHALCSKNEHVFDVVLVDYLEPHGELNDIVVVQTPIYHDLLKDGGIFLPSEIKICCQLMRSDRMEKCSRVMNKDLESIHIPSVINRYQVSQQLDLSFSALNYTPMSEKFIGCEMKPNQMDDMIERRLSITTTDTGLITGVSYWFVDVGLTSSHCYTTFNRDAYVSNGVFLTCKPLQVLTGDSVVINFLYDRGMFRMEIDADSYSTND